MPAHDQIQRQKQNQIQTNLLKSKICSFSFSFVQIIFNFERNLTQISHPSTLVLVVW